MENKDNINKAVHGMAGMESLEQMVDFLKSRNYIVNAEKKYKIGDPMYSENQFYFQFLIEFPDNEKWILHSTTSIRDRIKEQQWDSYNIKRLNEFVKKAIVVVPDGISEKEQKNAKSYDEKILEKNIFSSIDRVVDLSEAFRMIEEKAKSVLPVGSGLAKLGLDFEKQLCAALNSKENMKIWKRDDAVSVGYLYSLFFKVVEKLGLEKDKVIKLEASDNIEKLPSGGNPKTDVVLYIYYENQVETVTFSCKRSNAKWISVHEYSATDFANVLNDKDNELRGLLNEFQSTGGKKSLGSEKSEQLTKCLEPYKEKLAKWVIAGEGGACSSDTQLVQYLITLDENNQEYKIFTIEEYIGILNESVTNGHFGTPFQWTFPSKKKGKKIQLKTRVI